ncbi:trypsin-like peptidase domain-containing protein [Bacteroidales bacterium OttesenSCG-928-K03]|nr:trypsin-like peptidase domain-containing protein [Odoribacter sp. OttesenSCG-928-L07]MDL2239725.1 trypsin-like peptidase domain-containing protein [Bacteroidales bacterium OttesenSCG-928-L14]MDL2242957.1 trypsin-like peptidase domain-containing protein [Bacteroidales bacterium OttesenSCG-928-K03]
MRKKSLTLLLLAFISVLLPSKTVFGQLGNPDFVDASEKSTQAVVHIKTEFVRKNHLYDYYFDLRDLFNYPNRGSAPVIATGSGVIISSDGYIVTNNHVVQDAIKVDITLNDKRSYAAEVIGTDPSTDLALLKIDERNLPYLTFGDSDKVRVGEWVLAVGNPLNLNSTVTAGIVSAKARNINILPNTQNTSAIESFIQTDAALNSGNSGGALVNTNGELIGINTAIASGTGYFAGYSFAIPVNIVKKVVADLREYGKVQRALLGVKINDIDNSFAVQENLKVLNGVYVNDVTDTGNAKSAGIKKGDVITAVDGKNVGSTSELMEKIGQYSPNETVKITVNRQGKQMNYDVRLAGENDSSKKQITSTSANFNKLLGAEIKNATKNDLTKYNATNGVIISKVQDGVLKSAGIKDDFLITKVDHVSIRNSDHLIEILSNKKGGVLVEGKYPNGMKAYYGFGM